MTDEQTIRLLYRGDKAGNSHPFSASLYTELTNITDILRNGSMRALLKSIEIDERKGPTIRPLLLGLGKWNFHEKSLNPQV